MTDGVLNLTAFGDNRVSGDFTVTLEGDIDSVTIEGTFSNLPLETIPAEALDANMSADDE